MQRSDIVLNDGSLDLCLMLAKDRYGKPVYAEKEMASFSFLQSSGYIDESSQNPQAMYPISFAKSWIGGYGSYFKSDTQPRRYFASYGVDASEDGVLKLGPKWTAVNWPTVTAFTALVDGALEVWTDASNLTSWTCTSISRSVAEVHGGTYSALFNAVGDLITQDVYGAGALPAEFQSKTFEFSAWVYQGAASQLRVRIYDGQTTTYATTATTGAWVKVTHRKTLASNASQLTVSVYSNNVADSYADDCALVGYGSANANCYAEYNGLQYMSLGSILYKANSASAPTSWTYVANFGRSITALFPGQITGTAYLFIMLGALSTGDDATSVTYFGALTNTPSNGWYYDGTTLTQMTDAGGTDASGDYMTMASTTFYISGRPTGVTTGSEYVIRTNTAPLAGAWSADTLVGDPNTSINAMVNCNNVVYMAKEDSLWKVNTDGTVSMVVDYSMLRSSNAGKNAISYNGKVYVPVGVNNVLEYDPDSGTYLEISPASTISSATMAQIATAGAVLSSAQADFDGRIMALAGGGGGSWLWMIQDNGAVNNLFKSQYANVDGTGWIHHPVANTTMADVNCMAVSSLTGAPIIWVGHGTGNPGYYNLAQYETTDPTYTVPCLMTPYYTGGVWRMMKALYSIILGLESITASVYVTLQYRFYGSTSWATALTFDGASGTVTNGMDSNYMPSNSYGTAIQFRLNFYSGVGTIANGTGTTTSTTLVPGSNTITTSVSGTFTVTLPTGCTGTATTGTTTVSGSPQALVAGANTVTTTGGTGNFTIVTTGITTSTPKVTRLSGEGIIKPTEVSVIQCTVLLADHQTLRTGAKDTMPASRKLSGLNTCRSSNWPVTFRDILGNSFTVDVMSREDATAPEVRAIGNARYVKTLLLRKVTLS